MHFDVITSVFAHFTKWQKRGRNTGFRAMLHGASANTTWSVGVLNGECMDFLRGAPALSTREKVCKNGLKRVILLSGYGKTALWSGKWKVES